MVRMSGIRSFDSACLSGSTGRRGFETWSCTLSSLKYGALDFNDATEKALAIRRVGNVGKSAMRPLKRTPDAHDGVGVLANIMSLKKIALLRMKNSF